MESSAGLSRRRRISPSTTRDRWQSDCAMGRQLFGDAGAGGRRTHWRGRRDCRPIPVCGIELPGVEPSDAVLGALRATFEARDVSGTPETTTGSMPVVSCDQLNAPSLLKPIQAFRWFIEYGGRHGSGWENHASRVVPPTPVPFSPYLTAPYLRAPTLMMVGRKVRYELHG